MTQVILFVFGMIVGSFLNVVGLRFNSGRGLGGRSMCFTCGKTLRFWELLPVVSYLGLRGKCSRCKSHISAQYPLVELLTGVVFATVPIFMIPVFCIYIVILIYDLRHKIIPDPLVYATIILSVIYSLLFVDYSVLNLLSGPIIFLFFASVWYFSGGRAMGFGDAKLGLSTGLLAGAANGFSGIILSFWIGTVATLGYMFVMRISSRGKMITMKSEVPFAPFIIIGTWLAIVFNLDILHVALL